ncbi:N-acetyllactosaminide alpha-1,3-galactosyltransferase-like isoform X2 [Kryptolebias marmoratus]|uniref:N-acetyllactosaminide alpha-1,3-galactosyltransferase-like isoform X2 n=1 Tax=Kryptolebias marmoratus TaxID=37003 RepID=UPI0018ACE4BB|nr:N-acetyllactosaminide alpha-1,3-galactosyltransferase-like isoform X2 [Kryptolebias marmoratus]XP_037831139.1 N-acetyllactosaminide alpha-1,3-galactosyltransferase-like isoform X2 [Kryptolebias marmoratus]
MLCKSSFTQRMKNMRKCLLCVPVVLLLVYFTSVWFQTKLLPMDKCSLESAKMLKLDNVADVTLNLQSRDDVQTCTSWRAPIIWEGMFDSHHYDQMHRVKGSSVALTVFAVGSYMEVYLETFLKSSEHYFMLGLPVSYYVFTDTPEKVPNIELGPQRRLKVIKVEKYTRWQDISMMRMKIISDTIESDIRHRCTHVFCFDVDQVFTGRFGPEALGDSVAQLHAGYYRSPKNLRTYDNNPKSKAYMETGDFYYHAAVFGGTWKRVKALTDACYKGIVEDKENNVEALWHDESHLNKYFYLHKPSRILSPEYCWTTNLGYRREIKVFRLMWSSKYYDTLRTS